MVDDMERGRRWVQRRGRAADMHNRTHSRPLGFRRAIVPSSLPTSLCLYQQSLPPTSSSCCGTTGERIMQKHI